MYGRTTQGEGALHALRNSIVLTMNPEEFLNEKARYEKIAQDAKRHHWVPKFYLKNFSTIKGGKQVYMYQPCYLPKLVSTTDIATSEDLYTFREEKGGKTKVIEGILSEHEGFSTAVIENIIKNETLPETEEDCSHLAAFVATLRVRGPSFREWLQNMDAEQIKLLTRLQAENPEYLRAKFEEAGVAFESENEFEETRKLMLDGEGYTVKMKGGEEHYFKQAMDLSKEMYRVFMTQKSWHLLTAPDKRHFVTSDNPVVIQEVESCPPDIAGGLLNGTVLLPISPKLCLAFRRMPLNREKIALFREDVDHINTSIAQAARRQLYSHTNSKDLARLCNKHLAGNESHVSVQQLAKFAPYYLTKGIDQLKEAKGIQDHSMR